jgi:hypothetical protein
MKAVATTVSEMVRRPARAIFGNRVIAFACAAALASWTSAPHSVAGENSSPRLEFIALEEYAVFTTLDEVPITLRAFAPNDVILSAELFVNGNPLATAQYCCPLCPCPFPPEGQETTLRIPVPWNGGSPPPDPWQGWRPGHPGFYHLTAKATGQNGTVVEATPVTVIVISNELRLFPGPDGTVHIVHPEGSLVPGGFDLEASDDLLTWTRLGPFQPGNVAAFYVDSPPRDTKRRFYRAVRVKPSQG